MMIIQIKLKILMLSMILALCMYPKTIAFLVDNGKNIYIANKLSSSPMQRSPRVLSSDKNKIVFMFDDGWRSVYTEAYGLLKNYGYKASIPIIPSRINDREYMSYEQMAEVYMDGWELLNHSYSHKENEYDNTDQFFADVNRARQWMKNRYIGRNNDVVVIPYGEINPYLIELLKAAAYHSVRTSDNIIILNRSKIEYYPVTTINLLTDMPVAEVKELLMKKLTKQETILFILHKVENKEDEYGMTYSREKLKQIIEFIQEHEADFEVVTYSQLF